MIARELLVKLGFNIDTTKFEQFKTMADGLKGKMASVQKAVNSTLSLDAQAAMHKISTYNEELKSLSSSERKNILELNKIEKQAIKEVLRSHRQKHKELKALEDAALQRVRNTREEYQNMIKGGKRVAKTLTWVVGAAAAGLTLSLKNTLKDVKDFKTQKYHGEKTSSKFDVKQIKAVNEFNGAFENTKKIITEIRNGFIIELLPAISEVTKRFYGWLKANKEIIKTKLASIVIGTAKAINGLVTAVSNVVAMFGGWQKVISVVKVAVISLGIYKLSRSLFIVSQNLKLIKTTLSAGLNFKSLFSPITMITVALTGLYLIIEDFYVFSKGGKSVIGDIAGSDTWKKLEENIKRVTAPLEKLKELFVFLRDGKKGIMMPFAKVEGNENTPSTWQNVKDNVSKVFGRFMPVSQDSLKRNLETHKFKENFSTPIKHITGNELEEFTKRRQSAQIAKLQTIEQKPTYNMTINVPQGTSGTQAELIAKTVRIELEKHTAYSFEKTMAAIGGT